MRPQTFTCNHDEKWLHAPSSKRAAVFKDYLGLLAKAGEPRFDVVLVDGRVRGECAICALKYIDRDSFVIIHDWFLEEEGYKHEGNVVTQHYLKLPPRCELPPYKRVLQFYGVVMEVSPPKHPSRCHRSGLVVLRKKAGVDADAAIRQVMGRSPFE